MESLMRSTKRWLRCLVVVAVTFTYLNIFFMRSQAAEIVRGAVVAELADGSRVPYRNVEISLRSKTSDKTVVLGRTDDDGIYSFQNIVSGIYVLRISIVLEGKAIAVERDVRIGECSSCDLPIVSVPSPRELSKARSDVAWLDAVGGGQNFNPIALFSDGRTSYAVSEPRSEVYALEPDAEAFRKIGALVVRGTVTDHCLIRLDGPSYFVSVSHDRRIFGVNVNFITVTPLIRGELNSNRRASESFLSFGRFHAAYCNTSDASVYITDLARSELSKVSLSGGGEVGKRKLLLSLRGARELSALAIFHKQAFLGDSERRIITVANLDDGSLEELAVDKYRPQGLAVSPDGSKLFFVDSEKEAAMMFDLEKRDLIVIADRSSGLESPVAVTVGAGGDLLIADRDVKGVLRVSGTRVLRLGSPEN